MLECRFIRFRSSSLAVAAEALQLLKQAVPARLTAQPKAANLKRRRVAGATPAVGAAGPETCAITQALGVDGNIIWNKLPMDLQLVIQL